MAPALRCSIAIAGVSLTIAALHDDAFEVALVPHTLEVTTLGALAPRDPVNLEVDVLADGEGLTEADGNGGAGGAGADEELS